MITFNTRDLRAALRKMRLVVDSWGPVPVLGFIKAEFDGDMMLLTGTDLDNGLTLAVEFIGEAPGESFLLSEKNWRAIASIDGDAVHLSVAQPSGATYPIVTAVVGGFTFRMQCHIPALDFPTAILPEGGAAMISISHDDMLRIIRLSEGCISTGETRYYLNGIFLTTKPDGDTLRVVATDGHRMAVIDSQIKCTGLPSKGVIVHRQTVMVIKSMLSKGSNVNAVLEINGLRGRLTVGRNILLFKVIDGTYPDYTKVVPAPSENLVVTLSGRAMVLLNRAARLFGDMRAAKLDVAAGEMVLKSAEGHELSLPITGKDDLPPPGDSPFNTGDVGFDVKYLAALGSIIDAATLKMAKRGDPAIIVGDDPDAFWVLMPMRV